MSSILIILFIFVFIEIIVIGFIFSKVTIEIKECEFYYDEKMTNEITKLKIEIHIYFFGLIKITSVKLYKNYWEIFNIKIRYKSYKNKGYNFFDDVKILFKNREYVNLDFLKLKVNNLNLFFSLGTISNNLTVYLIPIVSTVFSILLCKSIRRYNEKTHYYKVIPKYTGKNEFSIKLQMNLDVKTIRFIYFIFNIQNVLRLNRE